MLASHFHVFYNGVCTFWGNSSEGPTGEGAERNNVVMSRRGGSGGEELVGSGFGHLRGGFMLAVA